MQENTQEIIELLGEIENSLIRFKDLLADTPVDDIVNSAFQRSKRTFEELVNALNSGDSAEFLECAKRIAGAAEAIAVLSPTSENDDYEETKAELAESSRNLLVLFRDPPTPLKPIEPIEIKNVLTAPDSSISRSNKVKSSWTGQEGRDSNLKNALTKSDLRIANIEQKLNILESTANTEIEKTTTLYSKALQEIEGKKSEIDNILGHVSGRAVAGDYEKSATEEKNKADWLRIGSLLCMAMIAVSLGYSFWETIGTEFNWQKSLFRITLTFLLSVPAAYLARESAKHREQQYQHLQTSLDLKAISPFLASLPDEEQHKIKIAIASKLFAGRDFSRTSADPFPLNTQEIIMELLKRLDLSKVQASKES